MSENQNDNTNNENTEKPQDEQEMKVPENPDVSMPGIESQEPKDDGVFSETQSRLMSGRNSTIRMSKIAAMLSRYKPEDKYHLIGEIARGGMGIVYNVLDKNTQSLLGDEGSSSEESGRRQKKYGLFCRRRSDYGTARTPEHRSTSRYGDVIRRQCLLYNEESCWGRNDWHNP